jgi:uncharacterized protein
MGFQYPSVVKNWKAYNSNVELVGAADCVTPKITFEKNDIKGAGIAGSLNLPVEGNPTPMQTTLSWHVATLTGIGLFTGNGNQIRIQSSLQLWDTSKSQFVEVPETIVMTIVGDEIDFGKRDSSTKAVFTQVHTVLYLAYYYNGKLYTQVDPMNNVCILNGVDINAQTRANLA